MITSHNLKNIILVLLMSILLAVFLPAFVLAQSDGSFAVGPGKQEVTIIPGQQTTHEITISNNFDVSKTYNLTVEDLSGSDDPNTTVVLQGDEIGPYSIRDYISFPQQTVTVRAGETKRVKFNINAPLDAEPGGYYGAVIVGESKDEAELDGSGAKIISRIGSLVLATIPGEVNELGELTDFSVQPDQTFYVNETPESFDIFFKNKGSVHLVPYGVIKIKNMLGNEVAEIPVEPYFALPESTRYNNQIWENQPMIMLGLYTATLELNRGYDDLQDIMTDRFVVLPLVPLAIMVAVLIFLMLMIRFFKKNFKIQRA